MVKGFGLGCEISVLASRLEVLITQSYSSAIKVLYGFGKGFWLYLSGFISTVA